MDHTNAFETHVRQYEEWFGNHPFAYVSELNALQELLPPNGSGIEIGVGTGRFAVPLGIQKGVEPSRAMAELAIKKGLDVVAGVAENLPFSDAEFDFALMVTTVCFLDDLDLAFKEAYRVLKPYGTFMIGFVDKNSPLGKAYELRKDESLFYRDATFYSVDDLVAHLKKAGFTSFRFCQTLFGTVEGMQEPSPVKKGYGEGAFVVIEANK